MKTRIGNNFSNISTVLPVYLTREFQINFVSNRLQEIEDIRFFHTQSENW